MTDNDPALETTGLSKRYRRKWGLQDCSFSLPRGKVAGLVGPNGAGKSTLLRMAGGLSRPTSGSVEVFGRPAASQTPAVLERVAYLDQERPMYRSWRVDEILHLGAAMNPRFDMAGARSHLADLEIDPRSRVRELSVGQQAQVALALCLGKRADLLLLDEPAAALDPLARTQLMSMLLAAVADSGTTVLLSSHAVGDLASLCDHIIILSSSRVQLAGDLGRVLEEHRVLTGPRSDLSEAPPGVSVVHAASTERQSTWLVRSDRPIRSPRWTIAEPSLEEVVLGYLRARPGAVPADEAVAEPSTLGDRVGMRS